MRPCPQREPRLRVCRATPQNCTPVRSASLKLELSISVDDPPPILFLPDADAPSMPTTSVLNRTCAPKYTRVNTVDGSYHFPIAISLNTVSSFVGSAGSSLSGRKSMLFVDAF